MPAAFIGHGSPMNALERNRYTESWRAFGAAIPKPRAILVISAHWFINATAVTAMPWPRTIHDFRGFPQELFTMQYPAPGAPDVAAEIAEAVNPDIVDLDGTGWGLDHGTWSVLCHVFPKADIPVVQLSIHALQPFAYHLKLGARLARLRERGILIVGSGNVVHNLNLIDWRQPDAAFDWNRRFDTDVKTAMTSAPAEILKLQEHPDFLRSVPTPEHFLPLVYLAGLATEAGLPAQILIDGYAMGSLSMTAYGLDMPSQ
jgi:4,5-DOPA dioxygenase extradiol